MVEDHVMRHELLQKLVLGSELYIDKKSELMLMRRATASV